MVVGDVRVCVRGLVPDKRERGGWVIGGVRGVWQEREGGMIWCGKRGGVSGSVRW